VRNVRIQCINNGKQSPGFVEKNPFGQIPVLEDGDLTIFGKSEQFTRNQRPRLNIPESRAICRYLESKYKGQGATLMPSPSDIKATAVFEQWASAELTHFDAMISSIYYQTTIRK
jgi:glutathione S-transferase